MAPFGSCTPGPSVRSLAPEMRLSVTIFVFSVGLAACLLLVPIVGRPSFPPYPDMQWQDVLDLAVPLVMAPLYWLLVRQYRTAPALDRAELLAFLVLLAVWIDAHGMHLAANSINNLIHADPAVPGADLIHFYDEVLSHFLWHAATIGLLVLALVRQWRNPLAAPASTVDMAVVWFAAIVYAGTLFVVTAEGGTAILMVPAAALIAIGVVRHSWGRLRHEPVSAFALGGDAVALVLLVAWFVFWGFDMRSPTEVFLGW